MPAHLKKILERTGYLNCALEDLSDIQIRNIEENIRTLPELRNLRPGHPKIAEYCGKYIEKPEDFKLMAGESALLLKLAGIVKTQGWSFFINESENKRAGAARGFTKITLYRLPSTSGSRFIIPASTTTNELLQHVSAVLASPGEAVANASVVRE